MKRSLIFLLAAGPFFVFGQRVDLPPTFNAFQFAAPGPGRLPSGFPAGVLSGRPALVLPGHPALVLSGHPALVPSGLLVHEPSGPAGFAVRFPFAAGFTVREMPPDGMPCLVPLRVPEQMPMSLRGNADPLPNAVDKP